MVRTPNIFAGVRFSPSGLPVSTFLLRMALLADATALSTAAVKLSQLKESSLSDARPTPPIIGIRLR
eukprot:scaffold8023_cov103-Isochrysis_galbana.AAC.22